MERRVFKLPTGYLNVDVVAISFTGSGTWTEAAMVKERSRVSAAHLVHLVIVVIGVAMAGIGMVFYATLTLHLRGVMAFTIAVAGFAWGIYKYVSRLKDDMAGTFRIPFAKVRGMRYENEVVVIDFINAAWKDDVARARMTPGDFTFVQEMFRHSRAWSRDRTRPLGVIATCQVTQSPSSQPERHPPR